MTIMSPSKISPRQPAHSLVNEAGNGPLGRAGTGPAGVNGSVIEVFPLLGQAPDLVPAARRSPRLPPVDHFQAVPDGTVRQHGNGGRHPGAVRAVPPVADGGHPHAEETRQVPQPHEIAGLDVALGPKNVEHAGCRCVERFQSALFNLVEDHLVKRVPHAGTSHVGGYPARVDGTWTSYNSLG